MGVFEFAFPAPEAPCWALRAPDALARLLAARPGRALRPLQRAAASLLLDLVSQSPAAAGAARAQAGAAARACADLATAAPPGAVAGAAAARKAAAAAEAAHAAPSRRSVDGRKSFDGFGKGSFLRKLHLTGFAPAAASTRRTRRSRGPARHGCRGRLRRRQRRRARHRSRGRRSRMLLLRAARARRRRGRTRVTWPLQTCVRCGVPD